MIKITGIITAILLAGLLCSCSTPRVSGVKFKNEADLWLDVSLYYKMKSLNVQLDAAEKRHDLKEVNRLQDEIDKRGIARAKLEGLWK